MGMLQHDRIRAALREGHTEIRVLLIHPMISGRDENKVPADDAISPPHFIQDIRCWRNGDEMFAVKCGPATAENPYFSFQLTEGESGDKIKVRWVDNIGQKGIVEVMVK
ncbi:MAG: thiosulfate oxidation carrier complex protein SoxZ [Gammaproteobacteria bacterium]|nr:thiosulfate oxidation carrier complex protein SoxZ [Gammaproteobacteria bacterium]